MIQPEQSFSLFGVQLAFFTQQRYERAGFYHRENEIFGEMGVIDDELRMADARCLTDCDIISVTKDEFTYLQ